MAPKLHRMLYATDLSTDFIKGMRYAVNYAAQHNAKLIVFHVISQRSITCSRILAIFFNEDQQHKIRQEKVNAAFEHMESLLEVIRKKEINEHPVPINKIERLAAHYGKIADEIVEKANRWKCEMIILGPRRYQ